MRPYHAWLFLVPILVLPLVHLRKRPAPEFSASADRVSHWIEVTRETPEGLDKGVAHRYSGLGAELSSAREAGYLTDSGTGSLWSESGTPEGHNRLERYYMAQSFLAPCVLRFSTNHSLIVVDCPGDAEAEAAIARTGLSPVKRWADGLFLARPGSP